MAKIAVVVFSDTDTFEALGRVSGAFTLASEAVENGDELKFIFQGAGTKWIGELERDDHRLHGAYMALKQHITGVCLHCASSYGVKAHVEKAGLPFAKEYRNHPSVRTIIEAGFQVVTF